MKKFAMAVVTASLLSAASAESCATSLSGFYAGVQAGVNSTTGTLRTDNMQAAGNADFKTSAGKKSFVGGIFAGYGMGVGSCAYVGAEFYGNFGSSNNTLVDTSIAGATNKLFKITAKNTMALGAKVRLGYTVSPQAMLFLGLGLEYAKWQVRAENLVAANTVEKITRKNKGKVSFAPSVGMDMFINKNMFVRAEYTYVLAAKHKLEPKQGLVAAPTTATIKTDMSQQRFALGFGYKF